MCNDFFDIDPANHFSLIPALLITLYGFVPVILCTVISTFSFDTFLKTGICISLCTVVYYFVEYVVDFLFGTNGSSYQVNFNNWQWYLEGNVYFISMISLLFISAVFFIIGVFRTFKNR